MASFEPDEHAAELLARLRHASEELEEATRKLTENRNRIIMELSEIEPKIPRELIAESAGLSQNMVFTVMRREKEKRQRGG